MDTTIILLPADCISIIISRTTPRDACRLSVVSSAFISAVDSDFMRENFLPSDYKQIFALDRESGKQCYMILKGLSTTWGDEPTNHILTSRLESKVSLQ
ncbi:hypothetical protein CUMW_266240 [Citrus unshiu]|uniref:F-box domain-containing protein n=1 Tax=Citrus unshiu TaxID=55188 RepID=A0A2H5QVQ5_CITUN|nr:hypothetical protein CUMW_266240 [Citrus unshiu]